MKNIDVLKIVFYALDGEIIHKTDRHQRVDLRLRIDDRDIRVFGDYQNTVYDVVDAHSGRLIAIQPVDDFISEIDKEWLNKECETLYNVNMED